MGIYLNPQNPRSQAEFADKLGLLKRIGTEVSPESFTFDGRPEGTLPVVWAYGAFQAAAVAYDGREFAYISDTTDDPRPHKFFYVPITEIYKYITPDDMAWLKRKGFPNPEETA